MAQPDPHALNVSLSGVTDLPPGKIAAVVTYLEMLGPPAPRVGRGPWTLERIGDVGRYRALFRRVGEPWLWFSRLVMPEAELAAILADPAVEAFALRVDDEDIALLELDFRKAGAVEIAFLGVAPEAVGTGVGRFLMDEAAARAWARPIQRLWVHTCTFDHPRALAFYRRSGFTPYKRAIEIIDDPRATGHLPVEAGPGIPLAWGAELSL
jgi:GNAT superfamily N-acetyltransferase